MCYMPIGYSNSFLLGPVGDFLHELQVCVCVLTCVCLSVLPCVRLYVCVSQCDRRCVYHMYSISTLCTS